MTTPAVGLRPATRDELPRLQQIREAAFAPVFASFRSLLGDDLYEAVQAHDDAAQGELLESFFVPGSVWEVWAADQDDEIVGFVAVRMDPESRVGEIGLNGVHPDHAGHGIGTAMYDFALTRMKTAGMRAAMVGTGGDPAHAPARRAYEKVGFTKYIPSIWMSREL